MMPFFPFSLSSCSPLHFFAIYIFFLQIFIAVVFSINPQLANSHLCTGEDSPTTTCANSDFSVFDYSAKLPSLSFSNNTRQAIGLSLFPRQETEEDYSCSQSKPCGNGACCSKKHGFCGYGVDYCGTTGGAGENADCWSNCNASAECGKFSNPPGKGCPLNVCCSEFGFCGITPEFCNKGVDGKGCQLNCDQPGSGASGGNVQKRVIGYYEIWNYQSACIGMSINQIPASSLTHLYFSFGYITPGDFQIVPMDGFPSSLFDALATTKKRNPGLKVIVALGGWTFNDNGTATQPVFSDMVSTRANRVTFINNIISFMRNYGYDGVDFDWEYPGAGDRGGKPNDGINFTRLLQELKTRVAQEPAKYEVTFTIPTSYWYLKHFDLKAVDHVDYINIMSYDLHGVWDADNPIGPHVLAHTNLTEIDLALNLLWRNSVPAEKLNLGIGFYGRSFTLSDPSCFRPGCRFKGGANPGPCTKNSGTLSYREITDIITQHRLTPFYDRANAIKYIVWNRDQWVSYDDAETIKQKIDYANRLGLGGLLIWSIDQDTADLAALKAVIHPKPIGYATQEATRALSLRDPGGDAQDCHVTGCGGTCQPGFVRITTMPCGNAIPFSRHSTERDASLCCPITSAPDPNKCRWRGGEMSHVTCNGRCHTGEVTMARNKWGDGWYCENGLKAYCCESANSADSCYWSDVGVDGCDGDDVAMTFAGTVRGVILDSLQFVGLVGLALSEAVRTYGPVQIKYFCCPKAEAAKWHQCEWRGTPAGCEDNVCGSSRQLQLTSDRVGEGRNCFLIERHRVYCCEPKDGKALFPPVPLDRLFPNPPTGPTVDTEFNLEVEDDDGNGDDPNDDTFKFWILSSPETIQVSLKKRDGSHWEVVGCENASSEEENVVQIFCTNFSDDSNCKKINLGHGVPGTILEMPSRCGPSKYAVAKSMVISKNQTLPGKFQKRSYGHSPVVYDLTFDYEWHRVPRDLGETQLRVDYSNENGYWDSVVEAAPSRKLKKRTLKDVKGNHKRWLEEEWRDDFHRGLVTRDELHARWFGSSVVEWIRRLMSGNISPTYRHRIKDQMVVKLLEGTFGPCNVGGIDVEGKVDARVVTSVDIQTSFGITIITKLQLPLDLSKSYLHFKNKGEIYSVFSIDARAQATYSTGDIPIIGLQDFPGATFTIPGLLTIGPNFKAYASLDAEITFSGRVESRVDVASWDIQQTYPITSEEFTPRQLSRPQHRASISGLRRPTLDWNVQASGSITAHLKPTIEFGVVFNSRWRLGKASVELQADGWMRLHASARASSSGGNTCPFTYGIDVGASLDARATAPAAFGWSPQRFPIATMAPRSLLQPTCPTSSRKRDLFSLSRHSHFSQSLFDADEKITNKLARRAVFGPLFRFSLNNFICPPDNTGSGSNDCEREWQEFIDGDPDSSGPSIDVKRDLNSVSSSGRPSERSKLERRNLKLSCLCGEQRKADEVCYHSPEYDSSGAFYGRFPNAPTYTYNIANCDDYTFARASGRAARREVATEHILEFTLLKEFYEYMAKRNANFCKILKEHFWERQITIAGATMTPFLHVAAAFPGRDALGTERHIDEFVLLQKDVNGAKEKIWKGHQPFDVTDEISSNSVGKHKSALLHLKVALLAYRYIKFNEIDAVLDRQIDRVGDRLAAVEAALWSSNNAPPYPQPGLAAQWETWIFSRQALVETQIRNYMLNNLHLLNNIYDPVYPHAASLQGNRRRMQERFLILKAEIQSTF